ncbi:MAG: sodium:alanine symporter family protein [Myxococcota bacterium]|jgi:AGCS family alanine or glycine:cation symporter|nr:sodium:alanine symporter family protein [Myxococcota bacterium]
MLDTLEQSLGAAFDWYNTYVGTYALMILLLPVGLLFTLRLKGIQFWGLKHAAQIVAGKFDNPKDKGDVRHFQALCTALSATVGTGNIAGVALAIYFGGPGAVFWLWMTGFLGMATKFAECTLAQKYREVHEDGSVSGGPMYYIEQGCKHVLGRLAKPLAVLFAIGGVLCSLGTGNMAQTNSMADAIGQFEVPFTDGMHIPHWASGLLLATLIFLIIVGGIKRIAKVADKIVPFMAVFYVAAALLVIGLNYSHIPDMFRLIFEGAFTGTGAVGGFVGSTFILTARYGIARGLFSNEAGQGSAPIAHAAAKTEYPVREGLVALMEPLVDTLIICTMTALVILATGAWTSGKMAAAMSYQAFETGLGWTVDGVSVGGVVVSISLLLFAFTTAVSWSYYGDRCVGYLLGRKWVMPYRYLYCVFVFIGAVWSKELVWKFVDTAITIMAVPNLIALLILSPVVVQMTRDYFAQTHVPTGRART